MDTTTLNKTALAIYKLLLEKRVWMDFDDIFGFLNPNGKMFSYAAVYKNIRLLQQQEILLCSKVYPHKRDYFCINLQKAFNCSNKPE